MRAHEMNKRRIRYCPVILAAMLFLLTVVPLGLSLNAHAYEYTNLTFTREKSSVTIGRKVRATLSISPKTSGYLCQPSFRLAYSSGLANLTINSGQPYMNNGGKIVGTAPSPEYVFTFEFDSVSVGSQTITISELKVDITGHEHDTFTESLSVTVNVKEQPTETQPSETQPTQTQPTQTQPTNPPTQPTNPPTQPTPPPTSATVDPAILESIRKEQEEAASREASIAASIAESRSIEKSSFEESSSIREASESESRSIEESVSISESEADLTRASEIEGVYYVPYDVGETGTTFHFAVADTVIATPDSMIRSRYQVNLQDILVFLEDGLAEGVYIVYGTFDAETEAEFYYYDVRNDTFFPYAAVHSDRKLSGAEKGNAGSSGDPITTVPTTSAPLTATPVVPEVDFDEVTRERVMQLVKIGAASFALGAVVAALIAVLASGSKKRKAMIAAGLPVKKPIFERISEADEEEFKAEAKRKDRKPKKPEAEAPAPETEAPAPEAPVSETEAPVPEAPAPETEAPAPEAPQADAPAPETPVSEDPEPDMTKVREIISD